MTQQNVWLITGASRGMGTDIAQAALSAGHSVVATGRDAARVAEAVGAHDNLLTVELDVTDSVSVELAVRAAIDRLGRIDVLVNNAGNFYAGFFETVSPDQLRAQMETNFFGALNVTRAVLPTMRSQRSGQVITVTSTAGFVGGQFASAYAASKFALEGWMESLNEELAPFGIRTMAVEPGFFRTELLVEGSSTIWPELQIEDYAENTASTIAFWKSMNGQQGGEAGRRARDAVRWRAAADPIHRGSGCRGRDRAEAGGRPAADRGEPGTLRIAVLRLLNSLKGRRS
jgi:NAD(P)-dependent dehydrogenase (short-subunit alcohol dehydrogenase family)